MPPFGVRMPPFGGKGGQGSKAIKSAIRHMD